MVSTRWMIMLMRNLNLIPSSHSTYDNTVMESVHITIVSSGRNDVSTSHLMATCLHPILGNVRTTKCVWPICQQYYFYFVVHYVGYTVCWIMKSKTSFTRSVLQWLPGNSAVKWRWWVRQLPALWTWRRNVRWVSAASGDRTLIIYCSLVRWLS